ncbi:MAG: hypothetical protein M3237_20515 [Actinomycetota bacterium]|nr:hypothetical protein [Actinomycetota bacterium]
MATDSRAGARLAPRLGLVAALLLVAAAIVLPGFLDWDTAARRDDKDEFPPLHGYWMPTVAWVSLVALAAAGLGWRYAESVATQLSWRGLLLTAYAVGLMWLLALAYVDGSEGVSRSLGNPYEYLETARGTDDVGRMLETFVDRIPYAAEDNWVTHVAGHPPGALLFFVGLVRIGLGGDLQAGLVVTAIAATVTPGVLVTLRALDAEDIARRAAPFLVLTPAAVFLAVSADAVFAAVAAWGLAALAVGATASSRLRLVLWSVLAGLLLGCCVLLSYGLPLLGFLALAVLISARSWLPLPVAAASALVVVLGFAAEGFVWWDAYPVLVDRYWDGVASERPYSYWVWANIAALLLSAGPLLGAGLAHLAATARRTDRTVLLLVAATAMAVLVADLSGMSKAEVERIWLPFVPWLTLSLALLPHRWRRWGLGLQLATALLLQHLLYTSW